MIWFLLTTANSLDGAKIRLPAVPHRGNHISIGGVTYEVMNVLFVDGYEFITLELEPV